LDRDAKTKAIDLFIAYDNTEAGRAVARQGVEFLTKKFGEPKGKVVLVVGDLSSQPGIERRAGSLEIFKKHPKIEVVAEAESVKWTTESAQSQLMAIFQASNEPPDAIISHTIPTPALNALRSKGWLKKAGDSGHVILVGINASWDALKNLKDGNVDGIVDQPNMVYLPMGLYYAKLAAEKGSGALPKPGDTVTGKDVPLSNISSAHGGINVLKEPFWAPGKVSGNPAMMHPQLLIKGGVVDLTTVDSPIFFGNALRMWEKAGK
jgi:ABC-type sugar transport system substrate-binding protein